VYVCVCVYMCMCARVLAVGFLTDNMCVCICGVLHA